MIAALLFILASPASAKPSFDTVLGARVGIDPPSALVRAFGKGAGEIRHYWDDKVKEYTRDDGWDWWHWKEANADVQSYWSPAFPVSERRIKEVNVSLTEPKLAKGSPSLRPTSAQVGWLEGVKMGMSFQDALRKLEARFGKAEKEFWNVFEWKSSRCVLRIMTDESGQLLELTVSELPPKSR